jgi:hypothetical protein
MSDEVPPPPPPNDLVEASSKETTLTEPEPKRAKTDHNDNHKNPDNHDKHDNPKNHEKCKNNVDNGPAAPPGANPGNHEGNNGTGPGSVDEALVNDESDEYDDSDDFLQMIKDVKKDLQREHDKEVARFQDRIRFLETQNERQITLYDGKFAEQKIEIKRCHTDLLAATSNFDSLVTTASSRLDAHLNNQLALATARIDEQIRRINEQVQKLPELNSQDSAALENIVTTKVKALVTADVRDDLASRFRNDFKVQLQSIQDLDSEVRIQSSALTKSNTRIGYTETSCKNYYADISRLDFQLKEVINQQTDQGRAQRDNTRGVKDVRTKIEEQTRKLNEQSQSVEESQRDTNRLQNRISVVESQVSEWEEYDWPTENTIRAYARKELDEQGLDNQGLQKLVKCEVTKRLEEFQSLSLEFNDQKKEMNNVKRMIGKIVSKATKNERLMEGQQQADDWEEFYLSGNEGMKQTKVHGGREGRKKRDKPFQLPGSDSSDDSSDEDEYSDDLKSPGSKDSDPSSPSSSDDSSSDSDEDKKKKKKKDKKKKKKNHDSQDSSPTASPSPVIPQELRAKMVGGHLPEVRKVMTDLRPVYDPKLCSPRDHITSFFSWIMGHYCGFNSILSIGSSAVPNVPIMRKLILPSEQLKFLAAYFAKSTTEEKVRFSEQGPLKTGIDRTKTFHNFIKTVKRVYVGGESATKIYQQQSWQFVKKNIGETYTAAYGRIISTAENAKITKGRTDAEKLQFAMHVANKLCWRPSKKDREAGVKGELDRLIDKKDIDPTDLKLKDIRAHARRLDRKTVLDDGYDSLLAGGESYVEADTQQQAQVVGVPRGSGRVSSHNAAIDLDGSGLPAIPEEKDEDDTLSRVEFSNLTAVEQEVHCNNLVSSLRTKGKGKGKGTGSARVCRNCGKPGHFIAACYTRPLSAYALQLGYSIDNSDGSTKGKIIGGPVKGKFGKGTAKGGVSQYGKGNNGFQQPAYNAWTTSHNGVQQGIPQTQIHPTQTGVAPLQSHNAQAQSQHSIAMLQMQQQQQEAAKLAGQQPQQPLQSAPTLQTSNQTEGFPSYIPQLNDPTTWTTTANQTSNLTAIVGTIPYQPQPPTHSAVADTNNGADFEDFEDTYSQQKFSNHGWYSEYSDDEAINNAKSLEEAEKNYHADLSSNHSVEQQYDVQTTVSKQGSSESCAAEIEYTPAQIYEYLQTVEDPEEYLNWASLIDDSTTTGPTSDLGNNNEQKPVIQSDSHSVLISELPEHLQTVLRTTGKIVNLTWSEAGELGLQRSFNGAIDYEVTKYLYPNAPASDRFVDLALAKSGEYADIEVHDDVKSPANCAHLTTQIQNSTRDPSVPVDEVKVTSIQESTKDGLGGTQPGVTKFGEGNVNFQVCNRSLCTDSLGWTIQANKEIYRQIDDETLACLRNCPDLAILQDVDLRRFKNTAIITEVKGIKKFQQNRVIAVIHIEKGVAGVATPKPGETIVEASLRIIEDLQQQGITFEKLFVTSRETDNKELKQIESYTTELIRPALKRLNTITTESTNLSVQFIPTINETTAQVSLIVPIFDELKNEIYPREFLTFHSNTSTSHDDDEKLLQAGRNPFISEIQLRQSTEIQGRLYLQSETVKTTNFRGEQAENQLDGYVNHKGIRLISANCGSNTFLPATVQLPEPSIWAVIPDSVFKAPIPAIRKNKKLVLKYQAHGILNPLWDNHRTISRPTPIIISSQPTTIREDYQATSTHEHERQIVNLMD